MATHTDSPANTDFTMPITRARALVNSTDDTRMLPRVVRQAYRYADRKPADVVRAIHAAYESAGEVISEGFKPSTLKNGLMVAKQLSASDVDTSHEHFDRIATAMVRILRSPAQCGGSQVGSADALSRSGADVEALEAIAETVMQAVRDARKNGSRRGTPNSRTGAESDADTDADTSDADTDDTDAPSAPDAGTVRLSGITVVRLIHELTARIHTEPEVAVNEVTLPLFSAMIESFESAVEASELA